MEVKNPNRSYTDVAACWTFHRGDSDRMQRWGWGGQASNIYFSSWQKNPKLNKHACEDFRER